MKWQHECMHIHLLCYFKNPSYSMRFSLHIKWHIFSVAKQHHLLLSKFKYDETFYIVEKCIHNQPVNFLWYVSVITMIAVAVAFYYSCCISSICFINDLHCYKNNKGLVRCLNLQVMQMYLTNYESFYSASYIEYDGFYAFIF